MTTTVDLPQALARPRGRWLAPMLVLLVLIASALAVTVLTRGPQTNTDDLDPANPGSSGARGLAQVLSNQGVSVTVVRSQRELLDARVDGVTTVAVIGTTRLSQRTARATLEHAASAASLVLLDPDPEVTKAMSLPVEPHLADLSDVAARCQGTDLGDGFRLARADRAYTRSANGSAATTCFADKKGGGAAMVALPAGSGHPPVTILGDDSLITNGAILDADNAAISLRLLGRTNRLIWYIPSLADIAATDRTSRSIAPSWFQPALALGISAVVFLCLWRGRRLGRLVSEPLPVVVRAVETTESRGRMYRKSRDRTRALVVLQQATRRRLASYLGLSTASGISSVAAAVAAVTGRTYHDVLQLLDSPAAHDDTSLLDLANSLAGLEKEVRSL